MYSGKKASLKMLVLDLDGMIQLKANNNEPLLYELLERYNITINITGNSLEQFEARAKRISLNIITILFILTKVLKSRLEQMIL